MMLIYKIFNDYADKLVSPETYFLNRSMSTFKLCGCFGFVLSTIYSVILSIHVGLSPMIMVTLELAALFVFLGLAMFTKIITSIESLTIYHYQITVIITVTFILKLLHQPVFPYLDLTILGLGMFLAFGRIGCFMVGCCHGKPDSFGVCYGERHVAAGFPHYLERVRLFPIQVVESLWVFFIVVSGSIMALESGTPGSILTLYTIVYGFGRFFFEFIRGDTGRRYLWGFSEAQWTSLVLMFAVVYGELNGAIVFYLWHIRITVFLIMTMLLVTMKRKYFKSYRYTLFDPKHIEELAEAVNIKLLPEVQNNVSQSHDDTKDIPILYTSAGLQISAEYIDMNSKYIEHYAISFRDCKLSKSAAVVAANLIAGLKRNYGRYDLIRGSNNVFHILFSPCSKEKRVEF